MYRSWAHLLEPFEVMSYIWEVLPECSRTYDPSSHAATTHLRYHVMCAVRRHEVKHTYLDGVQVDPKIKRAKLQEARETGRNLLTERAKVLDPDAGNA